MKKSRVLLFVLSLLSINVYSQISVSLSFDGTLQFSPGDTILISPKHNIATITFTSTPSDYSGSALDLIESVTANNGETFQANYIVPENKLEIAFDQNYLSENFNYSITLKEATDSDGNKSGPFTFNFTTGALPTLITSDFPSTYCASDGQIDLPEITINEGFKANFTGGSQGDHQNIKLTLPNGFSWINGDITNTVDTGAPDDVDIEGEAYIEVVDGNQALNFGFSNDIPTTYKSVDELLITNVKIQINEDFTPPSTSTTYDIIISEIDNSFAGISYSAGDTFAQFTINGREQINVISPNLTNGNEFSYCPSSTYTYFTVSGGTPPYAVYNSDDDTEINISQSPFPEEFAIRNSELSNNQSIYITSSGKSSQNICPGILELKAKTIDKIEVEDYNIKVGDEVVEYAQSISLSNAIEDDIELTLTEDISGYFSTGSYVKKVGNKYYIDMSNIHNQNTSPSFSVRYYPDNYPYCAESNYIIINVYNANGADQIISPDLDLKTGAICSNLDEDVRIYWTGTNLDGVTLQGITSSIANALVKEDGTDYYLIKHNIIENTSSKELKLTISYKTTGEDKVKTITQTLAIVPPKLAAITIASGGTLSDSYCEGEAITLVGSPEGEKFFKVIVTNDTTAQETVLDENKNMYFYTAPTDVEEQQKANYFPPTANAYNITLNYKSDDGCFTEVTENINVYSTPDSIGALVFKNCLAPTAEINIIDTLTVETDSSIIDYNDLFWYSSSDILLDSGWSYNAQISNKVTSETNLKTKIRSDTTGCFSNSSDVKVYVGDNPKANFSFDQICSFDETMTFTDISTANTNEIDKLVKWHWYFNEDTLTSNTPDTIYNFPASGIYNVTVKPESAIGCTDSITKKIPIFQASSTISENGVTIYKESFNDSTSGWISTTETDNNNGDADANNFTPQNSSWEISNVYGSNAWATSENNGSFNNDEKSWVESPCFDLSLWDYPLLEMKVWYNTPSLEGAVLQYQVQKENATWQILGVEERGLNWYSGTSISANPGGSIKGWAGSSLDSTGWTTAAFDLSDAKTDAGDTLPVKFRVAFATLNQEQRDTDEVQGFAFDDVIIKNKSRNVLIEHFTNVTLGNTINKEREEVEEFTSTHSGIVYIQYHTHEGNDPYYYNAYFPKDMDNDHLTRRYFYGLDGPGYTIVNGELLDTTSFTSGWGAKQYSREALMATPFDVDINYSEDGNGNIAVNATATRNLNPHGVLDNWEGNLTIMLTIAVIQKKVPYQGDTLRNVFIKYLPVMGGASKAGTWKAGSNAELTLNSTWKPLNNGNAGDYSLVGIVQYVHGPELNQFGYPIKEALQAQEENININIKQAAVTGLDSDLLESLIIYPNPANDNINIERINNNISKNAYIEIYSSIGKFMNKYELTDNVTNIPLGEFSSGMYIMKISDQGKTSVRQFNVIK